MTDDFATTEEIDQGVPDLPRPLVFLVEEQICVGNLQDYANAEKQGHYAGLDVKGPWQVFVNWERNILNRDTGEHYDVGIPILRRREPTVRGQDNLELDFRTVWMELDGETATYQLDLRA